MYFEFLYSPKYDSGVIEEPRFKSKSVSFDEGYVISEAIQEPIQIIVNSTKDDPPPDFTGISITVMSDRLVKALQGLGIDNLQVFKAELINPETKDKWVDYKAVNIIGSIACADLSESEYSELGGGILSFEQLVVDPERIKGQIFFRLAEDPVTIIAHISVGDHLYGPDTPDMTGFMFRPAFKAEG